jgi:hypothetical protein
MKAARRALAFYTGSWPRYVRTQSSCPHSDGAGFEAALSKFNQL